MKLKRSFFWIMLPVIGILFLFGNSKTVEARKYYSLQNIGLSGCTTDDEDYVILSLRGNTIKYIKYQFFEETSEWKQIGGVGEAVVTSGTKYYMGNAQKVSDSLRNKPETGNDRIKYDAGNQEKPGRGKYLVKKERTIDTEKWIYRVRRGAVKKNIYSRNNEIQIENGKVARLAVRLTY